MRRASKTRAQAYEELHAAVRPIERYSAVDPEIANENATSDVVQGACVGGACQLRLILYPAFAGIEEDDPVGMRIHGPAMLVTVILVIAIAPVAEAAEMQVEAAAILG